MHSQTHNSFTKSYTKLLQHLFMLFEILWNNIYSMNNIMYSTNYNKINNQMQLM